MKYDKNFVKKSISDKFLNFRLYFNKKYQNKNIHSWYQKNVKIKKNFYILDVGCGTGAQSIHFSKNLGPRGKLYSFDKSKKSIQSIKNKISLNKKKFKIFQGDMNEFKNIDKKYLSSTKFDLISSVYSIYYAAKPLKLIKDLIFKLKTNGKLVIFVPMKPNRIADIASNFYRLPKKVNESLLIYKQIEKFYKKKNFSYKIQYFRSKLKINNIDDIIKFYKSTTFYSKKYENNISEYLKKKYSKKTFIFKKDSCLITLAI